MSTKTTFKRVALVAVAALGLGVLSVAPSSAAVINLTVTSVNGTATTAVSDSSTAASLRVTFTAQAAADSATITSFVSGSPSGATAIAQNGIVSHLLDTSTSTVLPVLVNATIGVTSVVRGDSTTVVKNIASATTSQVSANFALYFLSTSLTAGTYTITSVVTPFSDGVAGTPVTKTADIVVSALAANSKVASAANTTAFVGPVGSNTADAAVSAVSTAAANVAEIDMVINNALNTASVAHDSVTATVTGAGLISLDNSSFGKSITSSVTTGAATVYIRGDGTAGVSTITVTTKAGFSAVKSVNFYATAAKTITASVANPVLAVTANAGAIAVTAVDASGINWTGTAYIVASAAADALVAGSATTPVQCAAWNSTDGILCPVTAIAAGTAKFKVIDASTVALATATSNEVTVTVSANPVATVKLAFDKATYAPFEKATITVTPLDKDGKALQGATRTNMLATGGITTSIAFGSTSDTLTATSVVSSATTGTSSTAGAQSYVVYMPAQGDVVITATGGTALPLTGQVAVTATASIVNSSVDAATDAANEATDAANAATDAALAAADAADAATAAAEDASAAVATLATAVNTALGNLKKQITALTKLVNKLLKK